LWAEKIEFWILTSFLRDMNNMFINRQTGYIAIIFLSGFFLTGWTGTWDDIRQESEKIKTISSHFTQTKHMRILSKPLVSRGSFYFASPDAVRWEYASPVRSILLTHKGTVKRFLQSSAGVLEDAGPALPSMNVVLQEITSWSRGDFNSNQNFTAELRTGDVPKIILTPKEKAFARIIERIEIALAPDTASVIRSITISEGAENYTVFEFLDAHINTPIDDSLFRNP